MDGYPTLSPNDYFCSLRCLEERVREELSSRGVSYKRRMANYVDGSPTSGRLLCRFKRCEAYIRVVNTKHGYHITSVGPPHSPECIENQRITHKVHTLPPPANTEDECGITEALAVAEEALGSGEVPVGCVFKDKHNKVVIRAHNNTNKTRDPTQHAELVAIEQYLASGGKLDDLSRLYVTIEPCIMCAGVLVKAGIKNVLYSSINERFGGVGGVINIFHARHCERCCIKRIFSEEGVRLLREFYSGSNPMVPQPKRPPE